MPRRDDVHIVSTITPQNPPRKKNAASAKSEIRNPKSEIRNLNSYSPIDTICTSSLQIPTNPPPKKKSCHSWQKFQTCVCL